MEEQIIQALTIELEETRLDIIKAIGMSDDKTAVHHLHGTVKSIESMLDAVYEEEQKRRKENGPSND